jgi:alkylhydroperoxidase family enzyme
MTDHAVRLPPLKPAEWTDEVRDFFAALYGPEAREAGTTVHMPLLLARHPQMALALLEFGRKVKQAKEITPRLREIVIMRVAWLTRTDYVWGPHQRDMLNLGMGEAHVQGAKIGAEAPIWSEAERVALRATDQLIRSYDVTDETWAALSASYSEKEIFDILAVIGQYQLFALLFNVAGLRLEDENAHLSMDRA